MNDRIVYATHEHARAMAPNVRMAEVREVEASHGVSIEACLLDEMNRSSVAWTWLVDDEPACMFGIVSQSLLGDPESYPWFLTTPLVEKHARAFARHCKELLPELLAHHPHLVGFVDARYTLSIRWLRWLGARFSEPVPKGLNGELFCRFEIGRERGLEVRHASLSEVESSASIGSLLTEYYEESANEEIGSADPQMDIYRALEAAGKIDVLAAFFNGELIGFLFLLVYALPHFGRVVGITETFFVGSKHRKKGAGLRLLNLAEEVARLKGATGLLVSAPIGGRLEKVLPGVGYRETNSVFFKGLK